MMTGSSPSYTTVAYHMGNARSDLLRAQQDVFSAVKDGLEQIESRLTHGQFLTEYARVHSDKHDAIVFFDIDCIPIKRGVVSRAVKVAVRHQMLIGSSQQANHLEDEKYWKSREHLPAIIRKPVTFARRISRKLGYDFVKYKDPFIYAAPNFLVIPTHAYKDCGSPSFESTPTTDVAGMVTEKFRRAGRRVWCLSPTSCCVPVYRLGNRVCYGLGTEFGHVVFHAFATTYLSDNLSANFFLARCAKVIQDQEIGV